MSEYKRTDRSKRTTDRDKRRKEREDVKNYRRRCEEQTVRYRAIFENDAAEKLKEVGYFVAVTNVKKNLAILTAISGTAT
jgi:hypothetical protein